MKKAGSRPFAVLAVVLCLVVLTCSAFAHSGRTDSSGGHKDNKNASGLGSYHYHHGYGPHLHSGGVCPYEVPVAAAEPTLTPPPTPIPTPTPTPTPTPEPVESSSIDWDAVYEKAKLNDQENNRTSTDTGASDSTPAPDKLGENTVDAEGNVSSDIDAGTVVVSAAGGAGIVLLINKLRKK